jgi:insertion element IS1 protein InsB
MALRLEKLYNINYLCTDGYEVYSKYRIAKNHFIGKSETALVESFNSSLRDNLARLNRRTKRFSRSFEMLYNTILLFVNKALIGIN